MERLYQDEKNAKAVDKTVRKLTETETPKSL